MPRPANPGWRPKTVTLSPEVIEAVWVKAAREGKTPGRVINEVMAAVLLTTPVEAEQSSTQPPAQALSGTVEISASLPSPHCEPASTVTDQGTSVPREPPSSLSGLALADKDVATESRSSVETQAQPTDPEQAELIRKLQSPHKYGLPSRGLLVQTLSERSGEEVNYYAVYRWRDHGSMPAHLVPHLRALIEEMEKPKSRRKV